MDRISTIFLRCIRNGMRCSGGLLTTPLGHFATTQICSSHRTQQ
jgi:hypothetical protein